MKKDPKVAAPKKAQKSSQKSEQKTEDNNARALREAEDAIREMGALQGWDEAEIARQIETMRSRGVKAAVESAPKQTVQKSVQKSEQKSEQKSVAAKPIATVREAKSWFMENFTPAERLGLGIIEVDGKPWSFVYCAGEVISGKEQFSLSSTRFMPKTAMFSAPPKSRTISARCPGMCRCPATPPGCRCPLWTGAT